MERVVDRARREQFTFRQQIRSGEMRLSEAMVDPRIVGRLRLYDLLLLAPGIGKRKATRMCRRLEYAIGAETWGLESKQLGELTLKQRAIIFRCLHDLGL